MRMSKRSTKGYSRPKYLLPVSHRETVTKYTVFGVEVGAWAGEVPSKSVLRSTKETRLATIKRDIITGSYIEH